MKRVLVLLVLTAMLLLTACGKSGPENAYVLGHEDITFNDAFEDVVEKQIKAESEEGEEGTFSYKIE